MNATEQRKHTTVVAQLAADVETVLDGLSKEMLERFLVEEKTRNEAVGQERTHRLELAKEQRNYVDAENRKLRECCQERWDASAKTHKTFADAIYGFQHRGFWSRLNWLITGR